MKYLTKRKKEELLKKTCASADPDGSGEIDSTEFKDLSELPVLVKAFQVSVHCRALRTACPLSLPLGEPMCAH